MSDYDKFYIKNLETNNFAISVQLSTKLISVFMLFTSFAPSVHWRSHPHIIVVPDPDFRRPGSGFLENFLDPEPDWISFLLKPDPYTDYPKGLRLEHLLFFHVLIFSCKNFLITWDLKNLMLDDGFMLLCNLPRTVDFAVHITVVTCVDVSRLCLLAEAWSLSRK